jgi:guanylate kinase
MSLEYVVNKERPDFVRPAFILLLGPSGAGKSTLIRRVCELDDRISYVCPFTDRPPRIGETDKVCVTQDDFTKLQEENYFLAVNNVYGFRYGTPFHGVNSIIEKNEIPILDFPLNEISKLSMYKDLLYRIYITPSSLGSLNLRLNIDDRGTGNLRYLEARKELIALVKGKFKHPDIDDVVINRSVDQASHRLLNLIYNRIS